jgi:ribose/xylose/arabinose/galactoside ABC-type transport system permease subunit
LLPQTSIPLQAKQRPRLLPIAILGAGGAIFALLSLFFPIYISNSNLLNVLRQIAVPGIIASGMTIVVIGAGFDLSVGAVAALAGVLAVRLAPYGLVVALVVSLAAGGICGIANGLLVWRTAVHPLIVTLGMRYVVYSVASVYTGGFIQVNHDPIFLTLGRASLLGLPLAALIFLSTAALLQGLLSRTVLGNALYAIGNNERAAFYSGVTTHWFRVGSYVISSMCAALAGVVLASRSGAAAPDAGQGYELDAIAAIAIGGVSLLGGSGSLWRAFLGVLLFGIINNALVLARQPYEVRQIAIGGMIIASLAIESFVRKAR